jgi:hypothetical protein
LGLHRAESDRREAVLFKNVGERAHGTRAERSDGSEKHNVDTGTQ